MYSRDIAFFYKLVYIKEVKDMLDAVAVGRVIQRFREERCLSQEVLSGFAGIGRTHLSAIERGTRKPTLETFFKISEALGVSPSNLMRAIEDEINRKS